MASIAQAENTMKSTATFVRGATDAAAVDAAAGMDALATITKSLPIVGAIFSVFHEISEIAQTAKHNKDNCRRAATRCEGLEAAKDIVRYLVKTHDIQLQYKPRREKCPLQTYVDAACRPKNSCLLEKDLPREEEGRPLMFRPDLQHCKNVPRFQHIKMPYPIFDMFWGLLHCL